MSSDSSVGAQNQIRAVADSGMVTLGPGQILRITASPAGGNYTFAFRRMEYMQSVCNGGVCKLAVASQTTTDPITVNPGEALVYDHIGNFNFRGVVLSNNRNVCVNAFIINAVTGGIESSLRIDVDGCAEGF